VGSLAGKTALVTGAGKRIGREIALGLAGEGASCLIHYNRSARDAAAVAEECRARGVRSETVAADLGSSAAVRALAERANTENVDVLVHNASTFDRLPFLDGAVEMHEQMLARDWAVHVDAPYLLSRIVGEQMVRRGWGRIVVIGDWSSDGAVYRNYAPYIVTKAAVPTLVKVLALELGSRSAGVTVNAVLPGPVMPPEGHQAADTEMVRRQTVLGRWVGPADIVRAVLFLVTSEMVTGTSLRVDGGRAIKAV
jgi:NAD(P)-dependent dehydrogenase (short-subunit alcohol dehydrogenase family)